MRVPNPTKLLPRPSHVFALTRRVACLLPRLPGQSSPETDLSPAPPAPSSPPKLKPVTPPKSPKPKPKAKAKAANAKAGDRPKQAKKAKQAKGDRPKQAKKAKSQPRTAPAGTAAAGFPEPPGKDPGDISGDREPHHALNNPVGDPDPAAWPGPYEEGGGRLDPHPAEDPDTQAQAEKLKREKLDD